MPDVVANVADRNLNGRVAVVTGGASGLGEATARRLMASGAKIAVFDADGARAEGFAAGADMLAVAVDVADEQAVEAAFAQVADRLGPVSILVNCAGIATPGSVVRKSGPMPLDEFRRVVEVNLLGVINCTRCAVAQMINSNRARSEPLTEAGVIINTGSIAAYDGQVGQAAYSASKGGVVGMVLPLARELGEFGIRIVGIAPGVFATPMTLNLPAKSRDTVFAAVPPFPKRPGMPDEFACLVMSIIENPMLNGEVIRLDGALRMPARL